MALKTSDRSRNQDKLRLKVGKTHTQLYGLIRQARNSQNVFPLFFRRIINNNPKRY